MNTKVLKLNKAGQPVEWINMQEAACVYAKSQVLWTFGDWTYLLKGGENKLTGTQSTLEIASVIATEGDIHHSDMLTPKLSNMALFRRDGHLCLYCGGKFPVSSLTRDHVIPKSQGGKDTWTNCVSACRSCNQRKGCRTPEEANMPLVAVPFKPNKSEYLALANRNILADQMFFLTKTFSKNMLQGF